MNATDMIVTFTVEQLNKVIKQASLEALHEYNQSQFRKDSPDKCYNYNQTAKMMGKSYATIKRMVSEQRLTPTADGMSITRKEIDRYLNSL
jgi:hypothetical protein